MPYLMERSASYRLDVVSIGSVFMPSEMLDHFNNETNVFGTTTNYDAEGSAFKSRHDNLLFSRFGRTPGWQYGQIPQPVKWASRPTKNPHSLR